MFRPALLFSLICIGLALAMGIYGLSALPDVERYAVHWDLEGNPNRYGSRAEISFVFFLLPILMALISAFLWGLTLIKSQRQEFEKIAGLYSGIWMMTIGIMLLVNGFVVDTIIAQQVDMTNMDRLLRMVVTLSALPIIALGNALGKKKEGGWIPINVPWKPSGEAQLGRLQRATGRAFVCIGVVSIVSALINPFLGLATIILFSFVLTPGIIFYARKLWLAEQGAA